MRSPYTLVSDDHSYVYSPLQLSMGWELWELLSPQPQSTTCYSLFPISSFLPTVVSLKITNKGYSFPIIYGFTLLFSPTTVNGDETTAAPQSKNTAKLEIAGNKNKINMSRKLLVPGPLDPLPLTFQFGSLQPKTINVSNTSKVLQ